LAAGYTRQATANIQPNLEINAGDFNDEFDALASAFDNTTGHDHSGSATGTGAEISLTASVTGILPIANGGTALSSAGTSGQVPISNGTALVMGNVGLTVSTNSSTTTTTGTVSRTHCGFGFTHALAKTTRILVMISFRVSNNTSSDGAEAHLRYGTGAAPAAAAAETGTQVGPAISIGNGGTAGANVMYATTHGIISGLTVGTTYWFDLTLKAVTGGTATIDSPIGITILEV
jgi:hypothetical protein